MRQESKLSFVKKASRRGNFKNVPQTVARKRQLWQCYKLETEHPFLHIESELSPKRVSCTLNAEPQYLIDEVLRLFPAISQDTLVEHPNWVNPSSADSNSSLYFVNFTNL